MLLEEDSDPLIEQVCPTQNTFDYSIYFVSCELPCRLPQDINLDSHTKNVPTGGKSPKADKPPTPNTGKTMPESSKPPRPRVMRSSPNVGHAPSFHTAPSPSPSNHRPDKSPHTAQQIPSLLDLGQSVAPPTVVSSQCLDRANQRGDIHKLRSLLARISSSLKPSSTLADS
jgi:hypothetical protein